MQARRGDLKRYPDLLNNVNYLLRTLRITSRAGFSRCLLISDMNHPLQVGPYSILDACPIDAVRCNSALLTRSGISRGQAHLATLVSPPKRNLSRQAASKA